MEIIEKRSRGEILRRYFVFLVSLFIMSFGVSLVTRSLMGTSPISSVPYVLSLNTVISMGTYIIILNVILIIAQMLMLGRSGIKENRMELLMQIPVSLLFGVFIDITMAILSFWHPEQYMAKFASCVSGCIVMALGISLEVVADVCMNSGEYVLHIASKKLKKEFGTMKILFDVTLLLIAVGCSWIFAGRIDGVREGTLIVAVLTGPMVRVIRPRLKFIDRWEEEPTKRENTVLAEADIIPVRHKVITIGREYGSGGHEIGRMIAEKLNIPFYDNSMMEMVAKESGLSEQTVRDLDQRLPHSLLYEMIMQDHSVPLERSISKKDALFVAQSRVIRRLASEGSCVIVGRCSDYVLCDYPGCIHIFLRASSQYKATRAVEFYGIAEEKSMSQVTRINSVRRDHYTYYTGKTWGDPRNYNAVFDTSTLGSQAIVEAISALYNTPFT